MFKQLVYLIAIITICFINEVWFQKVRTCNIFNVPCFTLTIKDLATLDIKLEKGMIDRFWN